MTKYVKKPIEIETFRYFTLSPGEWQYWFMEYETKKRVTLTTKITVVLPETIYGIEIPSKFVDRTDIVLQITKVRS
jgi:hypothetical protein